MEFIIKLNAYEVVEAASCGLLAGLANLEIDTAHVGADQADDLMTSAPMSPQPMSKQTPAQAVPASAPAVTPLTVPKAPLPPMPAQPVPTELPQETPASQPQAVPVQEASYSQEDLALAATQLVDAGKQQAVIDLLGSLGAQALTQLPKEQYGAFAMGLKDLGAKL